MVDALVVVESRGDAARDNVRRLDPLQVPVIYLAEVTSALRVLVQRGDLDDNGAYVAALEASDLYGQEHSLAPFLGRGGSCATTSRPTTPGTSPLPSGLMSRW